MTEGKPLKKRMIKTAAVSIALLAMLAATSFALLSSIATVDGSVFETARVEIALNGGNVIFTGTELGLGPGEALEKTFTVENRSTVDAYYRLYLENADGPLADALVFTIYDGDKKLYSGCAAQFNAENPCMGGDALRAGETKTLTAEVSLPDGAGNTAQNASMSFDIVAQAVQARNNPDKSFG